MNTRGIKFIENVFYSLDSYLYMVCFFNSIQLFEQVCGSCLNYFNYFILAIKIS